MGVPRCPSVKGDSTAFAPIFIFGKVWRMSEPRSAKVSWKAEGTLTLASTQPSVRRAAILSGSTVPPISTCRTLV